MKQSYMKQLKKCFGKKDQFFKLKKCVTCQFKRKCLLKVNGKLNNDED